MTEQTDTKIVNELVAEIYRLKGKIKRLENEVDGHKVHVMDVIAPDGNTCGEPTIVTFGDRTARVSHNHTISAKELAKRYPFSKRSELWTMEPNAAAIRALLTDDKVRTMETCNSAYLVVS